MLRFIFVHQPQQEKSLCCEVSLHQVFIYTKTLSAEVEYGTGAI